MFAYKYFMLDTKLFSLMILFISLNLNLFSLPDKKGKDKIYIPHLNIAEDVSETIREGFILKLKGYLLEQFGDSYNIVCQSDLDLLYRQAESFQKQGRDTREIFSEISEARAADEHR